MAYEEEIIQGFPVGLIILVESLIVHVQSITTKTCFVSSSSAKFCDNFLNTYELWWQR